MFTVQYFIFTYFGIRDVNDYKLSILVNVGMQPDKNYKWWLFLIFTGKIIIS